MPDMSTALMMEGHDPPSKNKIRFTLAVYALEIVGIAVWCILFA